MNSSSCPAAEDWSLHCCCNSVQIQTLAAVSGYAVLFFLLWNTFVLFPLKLVLFALFEMSRALGAIASCGRVVRIKLVESSSGASQFSGGNWMVIQTFGHLGSVLWGFACIVASADYVGVQVMAGILCLILLLLVVWVRTWKTAASVLFLLALIAAFWACTVLTVFNGLRFLILAIGITHQFFPLYNVCLRPRTAATGSVGGEEEEEESRRVSVLGRTASFVYGVISLVLAGLAVYLALVVGGNPDTK